MYIGQHTFETMASSHVLKDFEEKLEYIPEGKCQQMQQCRVVFLKSIIIKRNYLHVIQESCT